jgi:hypothetical protein
VLARGKVSLLDRALLAVAALALQKQLHALATAKPADGTTITCQLNDLQFTSTCQVRFTAWLGLLPA